MGLSKLWRHIWPALLLSPTVAPPPYFVSICLIVIPFSFYFGLNLGSWTHKHSFWIEELLEPSLTFNHYFIVKYYSILKNGYFWRTYHSNLRCPNFIATITLWQSYKRSNYNHKLRLNSRTKGNFIVTTTLGIVIVFTEHLYPRLATDAKFGVFLASPLPLSTCTYIF